MKDGEAVVLLHIRDALELIVEYGGVGESRFKKDVRTQDAILRRLEIVGEAVKRLSAAFKEKHASIPWRRIAGFRDVAIHHYDRVDLDQVWALVADAVPALLAEVRELLESMGEKR